MNEKEKLFAQFFNGEKIFIENMSLLELREHREKLALIAFEARARLTAVDERDRELSSTTKKNRGFSRSVEVDDLASNAINQIDARKKKLSKAEKAIESMRKLGIDTATAEHLASAGNILANLKRVGAVPSNEPAHKILNPFAKKTTEKELSDDKPETVVTDVSINEETNTIVITEETIQVEPEKPKFVIKNPFAK